MSRQLKEVALLRRIRTYDPPPSDFDPNTAPPSVLRRHGLPNRPDPDRDPHLARLWRLAFPGPTTFVRAKLALDPTLRLNRSSRSERWSGVVVLPDESGLSGETVQWAFTQFVVPGVGFVAPSNTSIGFWVGLGGLRDPRLVAAGIRADQPDLSYNAWAGWTDQTDPDAPQDTGVKVEFTTEAGDQVSVEAGDQVSVLVCAVQPNLAHFVFGNLSKGIMTSLSLPAGSVSLETGSSAEWIVEGNDVEWPERNEGNTPYGLMDFGEITFSQCAASTQVQLLDLTNGFSIDARGEPPEGEFGSPLTQTSIVSPTTAVVKDLFINPTF
jgi:hypothetical protein